MDDLDRLVRRQDGVVSRRQVLAAGGTPGLIARRLRRREWVRLRDGVFLDHTGPPTRRQREWAALVQRPGSVLAGTSALRASGIGPEPARGAPVQLAVPHGTHVAPAAGVRVVQMRGFQAAALLGASPPRLRVEHAALMVASEACGDDAAVAVLSDMVRGGATTPARLVTTLDDLGRLPRRSLLREVLADVGEGAESPLERRYLRDVERTHGLPRGQRQVREGVRLVDGDLLRTVVRDVRYAAHTTLVELDGVLGHAGALDRWADLDRDLESAVRRLRHVEGGVAAGAGSLSARGRGCRGAAEPRLDRTPARVPVAGVPRGTVHHATGVRLTHQACRGHSSREEDGRVAGRGTGSGGDHRHEWGQPATPYKRSPASPRPGTM